MRIAFSATRTRPQLVAGCRGRAAEKVTSSNFSTILINLTAIAKEKPDPVNPTSAFVWSQPEKTNVLACEVMSTNPPQPAVRRVFYQISRH